MSMPCSSPRCGPRRLGGSRRSGCGGLAWSAADLAGVVDVCPQRGVELVVPEICGERP